MASFIFSFSRVCGRGRERQAVRLMVPGAQRPAEGRDQGAMLQRPHFPKKGPPQGARGRRPSVRARADPEGPSRPQPTWPRRLGCLLWPLMSPAAPCTSPCTSQAERPGCCGVRRALLRAGGDAQRAGESGPSRGCQLTSAPDRGELAALITMTTGAGAAGSSATAGWGGGEPLQSLCGRPHPRGWTPNHQGPQAGAWLWAL